MAISRIKRLDRAGHGGHAGRRRQRGGRVNRHLGVEYGCRRRQLVVPEQELLRAIAGRGSRGRHHVGGRARGGRHRDMRHSARGQRRRLHLAARCIADRVGPEIAAGRKHDGDRLAGIDCRAAADRDQRRRRRCRGTAARPRFTISIGVCAASTSANTRGELRRRGRPSPCRACRLRATVEPQMHQRAAAADTFDDRRPSWPTAPTPNTMRPGQSPKSTGVETLFVIG